MSDKTNMSGKLGLRPKSYVVQVDYKVLGVIEYNYPSIKEATAHLDWIASQVRGQNGKDGKRKNVVLGYSLYEFLRSKKLDRRLPPVTQFVPPKDRERPGGGKEFLLSLSVTVKLSYS